MAKHAVHSCWHCSANILADEPEERVQGLPGHAIRYAHATEEGCRKAINRTPYPEEWGRDPFDDATKMWDGS